MSAFKRSEFSLSYEAAAKVTDAPTRQSQRSAHSSYTPAWVELYFEIGRRSNLDVDDLRFGVNLWGRHADGRRFLAEHLRPTAVREDADLMAWLKPFADEVCDEVRRMLAARKEWA